MTIDEFVRSTRDKQPPDSLADTLTSLWWDKKGDWDRAHFIAQNIHTLLGSAIHAYLHREEGVMWNADYWYRRAARQRPDISLENEWQLLVKEILAGA